MSSEPYSAPGTQDPPIKRNFNPSAKSGDLFEVARDGCQCHDKLTQSICCAGFWTPCCLLGATDKIVKSNFTVRSGPFDGCGSCVCCCSCALSAFCGYASIGNFAQCALGMCCVRSPIHSRFDDKDSSSFMKYLEYLFCMPCAMCTDYKTALNMVQQSTESKKNPNLGSGEEMFVSGPRSGARRRI